MKKYIFLFFSFLGLWGTDSQAQNTFSPTDTLFFDQQAPEVRNWLAKIGMDSTQITNLQISTDSNKVMLTLSTPETDIWWRLRAAYKKANKRSLEDDILQKMAFWCEISPEQAVLQVFGDEYYLTAYYNPTKNYALFLDEPRLRLASRAAFTMPPYRKNAEKKAIDSKTTLRESRDRITAILKNYYENQSTLFYMGTPNVQITNTGDNKATLRISNIKGAIVPEMLKTLAYYELITIQISLKPDGSRLIYECNVDAKHGKSVISEPRNSEYRDMDATYQNQVHAYNHQLIELLKAELLKP